MASPLELSLAEDWVDPLTEDWTLADDGAVFQAAQAGIEPAREELARRERDPFRG